MTRTYLTDALGSVIGQTEEDQGAIGWYAYSPYGEVVAIGEDEANPVQYTGRENDATGLYYYRARYYDPVLKRFISEDPIGLGGGINFHAYVGGNPIVNVDPEGLRLRSGGGQLPRRIQMHNELVKVPEELCDYMPHLCIPKLPPKPDNAPWCRLVCPNNGNNQCQPPLRMVGQAERIQRAMRFAQVARS